MSGGDVSGWEDRLFLASVDEAQRRRNGVEGWGVPERWQDKGAQAILHAAQGDPRTARRVAILALSPVLDDLRRQVEALGRTSYTGRDFEGGYEYARGIEAVLDLLDTGGSDG